MTGPGFTVKPTELKTHAGSLGRVADRVQAAGEKGGGIDFGIDAFGIIGQAFSGQARQVSSEASSQITTYAGDIRDLGKAVETAGQAYEDTEQAHTEPWRSAEGD